MLRLMLPRCRQPQPARIAKQQLTSKCPRPNDSKPRRRRRQPPEHQRRNPALRVIPSSWKFQAVFQVLGLRWTDPTDSPVLQYPPQVLLPSLTQRCKQIRPGKRARFRDLRMACWEERLFRARPRPRSNLVLLSQCQSKPPLPLLCIREHRIGPRSMMMMMLMMMATNRIASPSGSLQASCRPLSRKLRPRSRRPARPLNLGQQPLLRPLLLSRKMTTSTCRGRTRSQTTTKPLLPFWAQDLISGRCTRNRFRQPHPKLVCLGKVNGPPLGAMILSSRRLRGPGLLASVGLKSRLRIWIGLRIFIPDRVYATISLLPYAIPLWRRLVLARHPKHNPTRPNIKRSIPRLLPDCSSLGTGLASTLHGLISRFAAKTETLAIQVLHHNHTVQISMTTARRSELFPPRVISAHARQAPESLSCQGGASSGSPNRSVLGPSHRLAAVPTEGAWHHVPSVILLDHPLPSTGMSEAAP